MVLKLSRNSIECDSTLRSKQFCEEVRSDSEENVFCGRRPLIHCRRLRCARKRVGLKRICIKKIEAFQTSVLPIRLFGCTTVIALKVENLYSTAFYTQVIDF